MANTYVKDPSARLEYSVDWTDWLALVVDTVSSFTWDVPVGLTNDGEAAAGGLATVWLTGGALGVDYRVVCTITTAGNRIDQRTVTIQVRDR